MCIRDRFEIYIDNVFDFAAWIKDKEFPDDLDITDYFTLEGVVEKYERYRYLKKAGVMHLNLVGHEVTDEGTVLIFEKDGETLRAKTWYWAGTYRIEIHIENLSDFAAWVARHDFPADLDITDSHELSEVVVDFEEETGRS